VYGAAGSSSPSEATLDLQGMSQGAAVAATVEWLLRLQVRFCRYRFPPTGK
jgi:hypothetical protein